MPLHENPIPTPVSPRARTRASVARFVVPHAFSAELRIFPWSSISRALAWSSRASLNISSMRFVLVVIAPSEELRNQTLYPDGYRVHVQQGHG